MSQTQIQKPSTKPGTLFKLAGTTWHWAKFGNQYHIGSSRPDLAILPESGQVVQVIKASGAKSYEVIGPLLQRTEHRMIFERVKPAFSPVTEDPRGKTLDAFSGDAV